MKQVVCDVCGDKRELKEGFELPPGIVAMAGGCELGIIQTILKRDDGIILKHICENCARKIIQPALDKARELIKENQ